MSILIKSENEEREFRNKALINIGTNPKCDFVLNLDYELLLTVQYDSEKSTCTVVNNFKSPNILHENSVLSKFDVEDSVRINFKNSEQYIEIKYIPELPADMAYEAGANLTPEEIKNLYGDGELSGVKGKIEKARAPIEKVRVSIIKEISYPIAELKNKMKFAWRTSLFMHIALFITSMLSSFAVANYLMGLAVQEGAKHVYLATNIQAWIAYTIVTFSVCLILKQGVYLYLSEKSAKKTSGTTRMAKNFMLSVAAIFIVGVYSVNLTYYAAMSEFMAFAIFLTLFFVGIMMVLAIACGYYKSNSAAYSVVLNRYEFREDFETVIKAYRLWIERYINCLSDSKINSIKDRHLVLHIKSVFEIIVGILTAPFLAYGVSNTLAMCFPEAAGWVRISGLRFSPIFLVLATCLIIFAFFGFVGAFFTSRKIQASEVIKQDGFSDYRLHGVNIYGLEGIKKLESERKRFFTIACSIVLIEFLMNVSYFITEIGGDINGVLLSFVAALVPTALLIAETYMLSGTRFDIYACDELIAKLDKE